MYRKLNQERTKMRLKLKLALAIACLPIFLYLWPSSLGGDSEFIVVTGNSMLPAIESGSLAMVKKSPTYEVGDIAVYKNDALNRTVIHRIVTENDNGFTFQGDNNRQRDPGIITQDKIHGKVMFIAPYVGYLLNLFKNPMIIALLALAGGATIFKKKNKNEKKKKKDTSRSFFSVAILTNMISYAIVQVSISMGITPQGDGFTKYLFKIFEPYVASTLAFAMWLFATIGIYLVVKHYQVQTTKKLQHYSPNSTLQIKQQDSMLYACEAF